MRDLGFHSDNHALVTHLTEYPEPFLKVTLGTLEVTLRPPAAGLMGIWRVVFRISARSMADGAAS